MVWYKSYCSGYFSCGKTSPKHVPYIHTYLGVPLIECLDVDEDLSLLSWHNGIILTPGNQTNASTKVPLHVPVQSVHAFTV